MSKPKPTRKVRRQMDRIQARIHGHCVGVIRTLSRAGLIDMNRDFPDFVPTLAAWGYGPDGRPLRQRSCKQ